MIFPISGFESRPPPGGLRGGLDEARVRGHGAAQVHRRASGGADPGFEGQAQADGRAPEGTRIQSGQFPEILSMARLKITLWTRSLKTFDF